MKPGHPDPSCESAFTSGEMMLSQQEILEIERACERLVLDAAHLNDSRDFAGFVALFTPDGTLVRPGGSALVGRDAIRQAYEARPQNRMTRHLCTNIRITVDGPDQARGMTYVLVFAAGTEKPAPDVFGYLAEPRVLVGQFEDEFQRTPEGWRIRNRRASFVMQAPLTAPNSGS